MNDYLIKMASGYIQSFTLLYMSTAQCSHYQVTMQIDMPMYKIMLIIYT